MMKKWKDEGIYPAIVIAFLTFCFLYGIGRIYGFSLFPDEFGYWASAAKAVGYDWSEISSLGSYYSFGYSLILIPILLFTEDPVIAYRIAITVNGVLLTAAFLVLWRLLKDLLPQTDSKTKILFAGIAVCYPTWLLYMDMTLTEIVLVFTFVLVCYLLYRYVETMRIRELLLLALATGYLYTVHMRTVAIVIAVVLTVIISTVMSETKTRISVRRILITAVILAAGIVLTAFGKRIVQENVYANAEQALLSGNDYAGQWHKIKGLFTGNGMRSFLVSLLGKLFYLGMASFGLFYYGMAYAIRKLWDTKERKNIRCFYLFLLLAAAGQILVCAVYTNGYGRIDGLLYGRYDEHILPIMMALGCAALLEMKHPWRVMLSALGMGIPIVILIEHVIAKYQMTNIHGGYFIAGMSYLLKYVEFEPENYFWKAYALAAVFCLILYGAFMWIRKCREMVWILCVVIGLECLLGLSLGEQFTFPYNTIAYANNDFVQVLSELCEESDRRIVSYGNKDDDNFISIIQFALRSEKIYLVEDGAFENLHERDLVIVSGVHGEEEALNEGYEKQKAYGSFWLYYNE